ncbi:aldo-keto reductase family 1 member A1-B isoform X2 [Frankliniella occidentalis]|uniref:Aldo-keto reductase family 1 member A1-B isoform X2 n=1 Tax=Frankliniella occidentalis TaxID=133901 RepID=A0A9C6U6V2_FRAOC|nr:aldo-keto reductase family 1 member A1-B isoform X2 [Frankliniella occidentalis]
MASTAFATLRNGDKMPLLGYGTWQAAAGELEGPLDEALRAGYRHIDTAGAYGNEDVIGKIIQENWIATGKLKREDLFICTKLPPWGIRPGGAEKWMKSSLEKLRMDYVDMYLVHMPYTMKVYENGSPIGPDGKGHAEDDTDHVTVWKEMEKLVDAGLAKSIGVSNFNKRQIQNILDICRIKPANLQVELHMYMQQRPLVEYCHEKGIAVTAYSPIGSPGSDVVFRDRFGVNITMPDLLRNPVVVEVAKKYNKTPGQILLKHIVDRGIVAIPKSLSKERLTQNINIFDFKLEAGDVKKLDALDNGKDGRIFDMKFIPGITNEHPKYPFNEYP